MLSRCSLQGCNKPPMSSYDPWLYIGLKSKFCQFRFLGHRRSTLRAFLHANIYVRMETVL